MKRDHEAAKFTLIIPNGKPNVAIFNSSNLYSVLYYVFNYVFNIQLVFNIQHDI